MYYVKAIPKRSILLITNGDKLILRIINTPNQANGPFAGNPILAKATALLAKINTGM